MTKTKSSRFEEPTEAEMEEIIPSTTAGFDDHGFRLETEEPSVS
jgi:hypothetical protein